MPDGFDKAAALLPERLRGAAGSLSSVLRQQAEEIRLRQGQKASILVCGAERPLDGCAPVSSGDIARVLERATHSSLHSVRDELRKGYISAAGGVRVGVCGSVVMKEGVAAMRDFSSLSIRIPRQIKTAGRGTLERLCDGDSSVLIISPPGGGKTTVLRELVRLSSERGVRVALADERCEIAAVWQGEPGFDIGPATDVISGAPKAEAAMMLLRAMNPQVIALDEITAREDAEAIEQVANCGVRLYATAHADSVFQLEKRPLYRRVLELRVFDTAIVISGRGERRYQAVQLG